MAKKVIKADKIYGAERIVEGGDKYYFVDDDGTRHLMLDGRANKDVFRRGNIQEAVNSIWPEDKTEE